MHLVIALRELAQLPAFRCIPPGLLSRSPQATRGGVCHLQQLEKTRLIDSYKTMTYEPPTLRHADC